MDFTGMNVLVIGDICLDIIEDGASTRLSPEVPVPVILNSIKNYSLGMGGNVVANLKELGAKVEYLFCIGNDKYGDKIRELMKNTGASGNFITHGKTIVKKRILSNGHQIARLDQEYPYDSKEIENKIKNTIADYFSFDKKYDLVIIADYNKGFIDESSWAEIKPWLGNLYGNIFVDTKKLNVIDFYKGCHIFPNTKEILEIMKYNYCLNRNDLRIMLDLNFIIETANENGAYIYQKDKIIHCKAYKENIIDICGCGDTFISAFALFYSQFKNKTKALDFANYCSSKVALKKGTSTVNISEVMDFSRFWLKEEDK